MFGVPTTEPLLLHESNGENVHGWPVRVSEYLTLSRDQLQKLVEQERQKPTLAKLRARLRTRLDFTIWEAKDLDTWWRLLKEAELEYLRPQAPAYERLIQAHVVRSKKGGVESRETRKAKAIKWHNPARELLRKEIRSDKRRRVHRSAAALARKIWHVLKTAKKIRVPKEETIQDFILKERKSITLQIGEIEPA